MTKARLGKREASMLSIEPDPGVCVKPALSDGLQRLPQRYRVNSMQRSLHQVPQDNFHVGDICATSIARSEISQTRCSLRLLPQIGLSSKLFAEGSGRPAQDTGRNRNLGSKTIGRGETAYPSRVAGAVAQAVIHHAVCLKLPRHHLFSNAPHRRSNLSRQGNDPSYTFPSSKVWRP